MKILIKRSTMAFSMFLISALLISSLSRIYPGQTAWPSLVLILTTITFLATS